VDVTSLDLNRPSHRRPVVVVVVSHETRSRDVVKMVIHKLGMSQQHVSMMQLMAIVSYKYSDNDGTSQCFVFGSHIGVFFRLGAGVPLGDLLEGV